jgi:hypothetical protein
MPHSPQLLGSVWVSAQVALPLCDTQQLEVPVHLGAPPQVQVPLVQALATVMSQDDWQPPQFCVSLFVSMQNAALPNLQHMDGDEQGVVQAAPAAASGCGVPLPPSLPQAARAITRKDRQINERRTIGYLERFDFAAYQTRPASDSLRPCARS